MFAKRKKNVGSHLDKKWIQVSLAINFNFRHNNIMSFYCFNHIANFRNKLLLLTEFITKFKNSNF